MMKNPMAKRKSINLYLKFLANASHSDKMDNSNFKTIYLHSVKQRSELWADEGTSSVRRVYVHPDTFSVTCVERGENAENLRAKVVIQ